MEPTIKTGSIILIKHVEEHFEYKKGEIITFKASKNSNKIITHRIIEVLKSKTTVQYLTKGDNNFIRDPAPVTEGNIIGKYTGITITHLGNLVSFIQTNTGLYIQLQD
ncbi:signal peptidase I, partial [Neobacillus drentensis]|uniref:signal peptidase I n=1 Tax=Neobacillus drentensis TaxID=220684 RepID=UPI0030017D0B